MRRIIGIVLVVLGVLLCAGAGVVHWVLVPRLAQLPGDTNVTRIYSGNAAMVANPTVVTGTRIGPALLRDVPVEVQHNTKVVATRGHQALVRDTRVLTIPGYTLATLVNRFDVDRRTFMPGHAFANASPAQGLTFNWPMSTKPQNYSGWVSDIGRTTTAHYMGTAKHGGVDTYVFRVHTNFAPITDPQILALLPPVMTQRQLLDTTPSLQFSQKHLLKLNEILATAPRIVSLAYDYKVDATFWVAPASGLVVDHQQSEVRFLSLLVNGKKIPIAPVMDMKYAFTPATVTAAASDAKDSAAQLSLLRSKLPFGMLVTGPVLLLVGLVLLAGGRRTDKDIFSDEELAEVLLSDDTRVPSRFLSV